MYRLHLTFFLFILISNCFSQQSNQYTFDKTTFNQINSKKHIDGLYTSFNDLINEHNSYGDGFQMIKSLDTTIFDDKYETYTISYNNDLKLDSVLEKNVSKKDLDYFEETDFRKQGKPKVFPLVCYNDTFYYLIYHDFNKKEYNYAKIPKNKPFHTINLLIPIELYNYYQRKNDDNESIKYILIWNFGIVGAVIATSITIKEGFITKPSRRGFDHLKSNSSIRFDQWGSIVDNYILSTFIFSPVYGGIIEASYAKTKDILEQRPELKAQINDREMVDIGDGMQMPKYKYTRTTVYKLIDKLNMELLKF